MNLRIRLQTRHLPWLMVPLLLLVMGLHAYLRPSRHATQLYQVFLGLLMVIGLGVAAWMGREPPKQTDLFDAAEGRRARAWGYVGLNLVACWMLLLLGSRLGGMVLAFMHLAAMAWLAARDRNTLLWASLALLCVAVLVPAWDLYRVERMVMHLFGPMDARRWHYEHNQWLRELVQQSWLGGASGSPVRHPDSWVSNWPLTLMRKIGVLPVAVLLAGLSLWLGFLAAALTWPAGATNAPGWLRRAVAALAWMHAATVALYVLWVFGLLRQPLGIGVPPFVRHGAWWMLSLALIVGGCLCKPSGIWPPGRWARWSRPQRGIGWGVVALVALSMVNVMVVQHTAAQAAQTPAPSSAPKALPTVLDREGRVLAHDVPAWDVLIRPDRVFSRCQSTPRCTIAADNAPEAQRLVAAAEGFAEAQSQLRHALSPGASFTPVDRWVVVAMGVPDAVVQRLKAIDPEGVRTVASRLRLYSHGELFAHALGYSGLGDQPSGAEGLEHAMGFSRSRQLTPVAEQPSPLTVRTTLDLYTQHAAHSALVKALGQYGATSGAAVVLDPRSGAVQAMVSLPDFDPNVGATFRRPYQPERIRNRALFELQSPGSLLTPLLMARALQDGLVTPDTVFDTSAFAVSDVWIRDTLTRPRLNATEVVTLSSNVGLARLSLARSAADLSTILAQMGFGEPLRADGMPGGLPGQVGPVNPDTVPPTGHATGNGGGKAASVPAWRPIEQAAVGHAMSSTFMQLMQAYQPLATMDGRQRPLRLLHNADCDDSGREEACIRSRAYTSGNSAEVRYTPQVAASVRNMLAAAAGPQGTAGKAQVAGLGVGGKAATVSNESLTAPVARAQRNTTAMFIGMAPIEQPRWLVGVMLNFPEGHHVLAGDSAAPAFAQIVERLAVRHGMVSQPADPPAVDTGARQ